VIVVFLVLTPSGLVGGNQRFGATYHLNLLPENKGLTMEAACSSKTLVTTNKTTRRHSTEDPNRYSIFVTAYNITRCPRTFYELVAQIL
jgi:hypothetical protein